MLPFKQRCQLENARLIQRIGIVIYVTMREGRTDLGAVDAVFVGLGEGLIARVEIRSGFLKHMVRNIVGVLLEAGKGNLTRKDIEKRFDPACAIPPGPSVPARGLFLISVEY